MGSSENVNMLKDICSDLALNQSDDSDNLVIASGTESTTNDIPLNILEDTELEDKLDETAAKNNLKSYHVKKILKQVISSSEVIELIRDVEDPLNEREVKYEPKLTRAKAKLMYENGMLHPWNKTSRTPREPTDTAVLMNGDLPDDSSGEEYVPGEGEDEESDEDTENAKQQDASSPKSIDSSTQTIWEEESVFKHPKTVEIKSPKKSNEVATIALRTRSKLDLISTPLQEIEKQLVPPDVVETEEEDADIDEHEVDWKKFLDEFTKPLEEIATNADPDEEHDPEYNVLADEQVEELDIEELRADRGVKITRKELNQLITELVDCADNYSSYFPQSVASILPESTKEEKNISYHLPDEEKNIDEANASEERRAEFSYVVVDFVIEAMNADQEMLLAQQIRQHLQLLCQHFLLTFSHPQFHSNAGKCKEYVNDINNATVKKAYYSDLFVEDAIELIEDWEETINSDSPAIRDYKEFCNQNIYEMKKSLKEKSEFTPLFHKLILQTISESKVFLYPSLLPRAPFTFNNRRIIGYTDSEIQLICLGLEQFIPFMKMDKKPSKKHKDDVNLREVCLRISTYMMPSRKFETMYKFVSYKRRTSDNPIRKYFDTKEVDLFNHYITPITHENRLAPIKRNADELFFQWRHYIFPELAPDLSVPPHCYIACDCCTNVDTSPANNEGLRKTQTFCEKDSSNSQEGESNKSSECEENTTSGKLLCTPQTANCSEPLKPIPQEVRLLNSKFNSSILTHIENMSAEKVGENDAEEQVSSTQNTRTEESIIDSTVPDAISDYSGNEKDNFDEALVASSTKTPPTTTKRRQTVLEKKRVKIRRNFEENLKLLAEESPETVAEKQNRFIQAYYDKVQETLDLKDFHKFMTILNDFDDSLMSATILYNRIEEILGEKHPELLDEFLLFLDSGQAKSIGKLVPYLILSNMSFFLRKLEVFFQDQPPQLRKIFKCLTELSSKSDVSLEQVKQTIVPLLKGNALLNDWFLQIFPSERPSKTLINNGDWEDVGVFKEVETCEVATLPQVEDPYGGANCICKCHLSEEEAFKTRTKHCLSCGTRFLQDGVFLHTCKSLHPISVKFDADHVDHKARLAPPVKIKRADATSSSSSSKFCSGKESQEETRQSSDDEKNVRGAKKGAKPKLEGKKLNEKKVSTRLRKTKNINSPASSVTMKKLKVYDVPPEPPPPQMVSEEQSECEGNVSMDSCENKRSQSDESDLLSQDDSDFNCPEQGHNEPSTSNTIAWTRDEDKIILEAFQTEEVAEKAYEEIGNQLPHRTLEELKVRFEVLVNFLKTMTNGAD